MTLLQRPLVRALTRSLHRHLATEEPDRTEHSSADDALSSPLTVGLKVSIFPHYDDAENTDDA